MAEIKFSCPQCSQHIQCDAQYGGLEIACPGCQTNIVVPQAAGSAPAAAIPRTPAPARPTASRTPPRQIALVATVVLVVGAGVVYVVTHINSWQGKMDAHTAASAAKSDGGEMGHIANVYKVLNDTDPTRGEAEMIRANRERDRREKAPHANTLASNKVAALPLLPAVWTHDLAAAAIPEGRANGKLAGADFIVDSAKVVSGANHILTLRQGTNAVADREISIFLKLPAGQELAGHSWTASADMKFGAVPTVTKRWVVDPKFAPKEKSFALGYVMKLEFGEEVDGLLPGTIYLALPDEEKSVVAGAFIAALPVPVLQMRAGDFRMDH